MKGQIDIELQRLIRARYNTAVENWSEWKWLEIESSFYLSKKR